MKSIYITTALFFTLHIMLAQQGILDTSFGVNGIQKSLILNYNPINTHYGAKKILFKSNGNILYAGNDLINGGIYPTNTNPSIKIWNKKTNLNDCILDINDNIFSIGFTMDENDNKSFFLTKLKSSTTGQILDNTFNFDGKVVFDTKEIDEEAIAVKLQTDNKIIVLGFSGTKGILIRYNSNGYLDRTFNEKGFYNFQIQQNTKPNSLEIQSDGKIIVAGNCFNGSNIDFFLSRINTNGTLDTTFGSNGIVIKDVNNRDNPANKMITANDGSIYIGGKVYANADSYNTTIFSDNVSIFKYNSNGQLSTTFTNGIIPGALVYSSIYGTPGFIPYQSQNEELLNMTYDNVNNYIRFFGYYIKYLNPAFKTALEGYIALNDSAGTFYTNQQGNNLNTEIVFGTIKPSDMNLSQFPPTYHIIKFDNCTSGSSTFVKTPTNTFIESCNNISNGLRFEKLEKTTDGYYGLTSTQSNGGLLYKLNTNFEVDTTFGTDGNIPNILNFKIDIDNKLICTKFSNNLGFNIILQRFFTSGKIDTSFGEFGYLTGEKVVINITVTPQNDYLLICNKYVAGQNIVETIKIKNSGILDNTYGLNNGYSDIFSFVSYPANFPKNDNLTSDNSGNYYSVITSNNTIQKLIKISNNGILDITFGLNGIVDLYPVINSYVIGFLRLDSGKFLIYTNDKIAQLNQNGTLDNSFGNNGIIVSSSLLPDFYITKVISNLNGHFIGGYRTNGGDSSTILKLNELGTIDNTFGINGKYVDIDSNYLNISYSMSNMYIEQSNKIVFYGGTSIIKRIN